MLETDRPIARVIAAGLLVYSHRPAVFPEGGDSRPLRSCGGDWSGGPNGVEQVNRLFQGRTRAQWSVTLWLALLAAGLVLVGVGIGWDLPGAGAWALLFLILGVAAVGVALWRLRGSAFGVTFAIMEQQTSGNVLISSRRSTGLPDAVVFSGHMGMIIALNGLQDLIGRVTAVTPPGADYRSISRLLQPAHPRARIISATAENAELCAWLEDGEVVRGSMNLENPLPAPIQRVFLSSGASTAEASTSWPVSRGLDEALNTTDFVVFGPGSFFTSVVPFFLVPGLRERLASIKATTIYLCNVMTEPGRTDGWTVSDFIRNFTDYAGFAPQFTVVNRSYPGSNILNRYEVTGSYPVMVTPEEHLDASKVMVGSRLPGSTTLAIGGSTVIEADIIEVINEARLILDPQGGTASEQTVTAIRHDSDKLARILRSLIALTRAQPVVS
jgi:uncharacterized cofD-like protein